MKKLHISPTKALFFLLGSLWLLITAYHFFMNFYLLNYIAVVKNIILFVVLNIVIILFGLRILHYLSLCFDNFFENIVFGFATGSVIITYTIIILCYLRLTYEYVIFILIIAIFIFSYKEYRNLIISFRKSFQKGLKKTTFFINKTSRFLIILALLITFVSSLTPIFFFDALACHVSISDIYLHHHGFKNFPFNHFTNFPSNINIFYILGLSLSDGMLVKLISWSFGFYTMLSVYAFTSRFINKRYSLISPLVFIFTPGILILMTHTTIDLGVMFYSFLGVYLLYLWSSKQKRVLLLLSSSFTGYAIASKYTAFVTTLIPFVLFSFLLTLRMNGVKLKSKITSLFLLFLVIFVMLSPWIIKNLLYTGNPVYPLLNNVFHSKVVDGYSFYDEHISNNSIFSKFLNKSTEIRNFSFWKSYLINLIIAPWTYSMKTIKFAGRVGIFFLSTIPLLLFYKNKNCFVKQLLILGLTIFYSWLLFLPNTAIRYSFQMIPPLSIVSAYLIITFMKHKKLRNVAYFIVYPFIGFQFLIFISIISNFGCFDYLFKNQSKEEFLLNHNVQYYPVIEWANKNLPIDSKILFEGEVRGYYCQLDYVVSSNSYNSDKDIILMDLIKNSERIEVLLENLKRLGVTHILFNKNEMGRFASEFMSRQEYYEFTTEKDIQMFNDLFEKGYLDLLYYKYDVFLYQINY